MMAAVRRTDMSWGQAVRWLWAAAVAWGLYGLLLYGHARDALGSCAFNPAPYRAHLFELDAQRTERAHAYLSQLVAETAAKADAAATSPQQKTGNELCMVISTVDRPGARYLLQSTASILKGLSETQKTTNDKNKSADYVADLELLRRTPGVELIEGSPHVPTAEEAKADAFVQWLSKERDDYVFTLNQCRNRGAKYILLFEDDVWAADHWYSRLLPNLHKLEAVDAQLEGDGSSVGEWAFVKLYMAVQYDEYDLFLHARDVVFFVSWGVAWGLIAIAAYVVFLVIAHSRRLSAVHGVRSRSELVGIVMRDWNTLVCAFVICNVVAAALCAPICISKQNFAVTRKPDGVWPTISRSCAQAQLFKAGSLLDRTVECVMANDYRVKKDGVDLLVSDCARKVGGTVYENIPHLFQHIGIHSSSSVKRQQQDHTSWIPHMSVYFEETIDASTHRDLVEYINSRTASAAADPDIIISG